MRQGAGTLLVRTTGESPIGPERHAGRSLALCDGQGRSRGVLQGRPILRGMAEWTRQRGAGQRAKGDVTPASTDSPGAPSSLFLPNPHLPTLPGPEGCSLSGQVEAPPSPLKGRTTFQGELARWRLVFFLSLAVGDSAHLVVLGEGLCPFQLKGKKIK